MDYLDALRRHGWVADPGDRVTVEAMHDQRCPSGHGGPCNCVPRLELRTIGPAPPEARPANVVAGPGRLDEDAAQVG